MFGIDNIAIYSMVNLEYGIDTTLTYYQKRNSMSSSQI